MHIEYRVYGKGDPAIVLIHGWATDATYWYKQIDKALARGRFIIHHKNADSFSRLGHWPALLRILAATRWPPLYRLRYAAGRRSGYFRQDGDQRCVRV